MARLQVAGVCVVLAALAVTGGSFALLGCAAAVMTGGTGLTHVMGLGGVLVGGTAFVTVVGTGLSPHEDDDIARAGRVLRLLIPATGVLSLVLLAAIALD